MRFKYTALDGKGKKTSGEIEAANKAGALASIKALGLSALSVKEDGPGPAKEKSSGRNILQMEIMEKDVHKQKLKGKKVLSMLEQLAIMSRAGVPLTTCMHVLVLQEKDRKVLKILMEIQEDLHAGMPIASSMAKFAAFNQVTTSIISAGEIDGRLDEAFARAAKIMEVELSLTSKIRSAMGYPIFLLLVTIGVTILLNLVVLPTFTGMFNQFGQELPALTRFVMKGSDILVSFWFLILGFFAVIIFGFIYGRRKSDKFRMAIDKFILKIPLIGEIFYKLYISRFSRVMASLAGSGVEIIHSLSTASSVIPNTYLRSYFLNVRDDVRLGININDSMRRHSVFDTLFTSMVGIGEESGDLPAVLDKMAELYEAQTENQTKLLVALVEPTMTVIMAVVVGVVVLSVVLPMFGQYSLLM